MVIDLILLNHGRHLQLIGSLTRTYLGFVVPHLRLCGTNASFCPICWFIYLVCLRPLSLMEGRDRHLYNRLDIPLEDISCQQPLPLMLCRMVLEIVWTYSYQATFRLPLPYWPGNCQWHISSSITRGTDKAKQPRGSLVTSRRSWVHWNISSIFKYSMNVTNVGF